MILLFVFVFVFLLVVGHLFYWQTREGAPITPKFFAHRGIKVNSPENTLASYKEAINLGFNGIEMDVCSLGDGTIVCSHNYDLERETNGFGWLNDLDYSELNNIKTGIKNHPKNKQPIPRLIDVLNELPEKTFLNIEIKYKDFFDLSTAKAIGQLSKKKIIEQPFLVSSFNPFIIAYLKIFHREIFLGYLIENNKWCWLINILHPDFIHPDGVLINQGFLDKCNAHKIKINTWTINSISSIEWCKKNNISSIITDNPEVLKYKYEKR